ncbi:MAG TPA: ABC transporter ATP-binding protein, partial [Microbacterium ginsengisoli]|nr:ABC transporter ATP-binding protein [Microbacterium ginsengisoli]
HQLDVVERLCDELVIIAGGTIRAAGTRAELRAQHEAHRFELVSATDAGWLRGEPGVTVVEFAGGHAVFDVDDNQTAQRVLRRAVELG